MTKFEEEFEHELDYFIERELSLDEKLSFGARDVLVKFFSGWHSPEHIEKEIQMKLLKLQQQALPVVPECVGEWIEILKTKGLKPLKNPETYGETGFTEEKLQNIVFWISENQEDYMRAWLDGYTVEKPQLFYLKHIDMSKADKEFDHYLFRIEVDRLAHHIVNKNNLPHNYRSVTFTQQEIDSMQTGSYEQIEVEK